MRPIDWDEENGEDRYVQISFYTDIEMFMTDRWMNDEK